MKNLFIALLKCSVEVIISIIIGFVLIISVFCIPTDKLTQNVKESLPTLKREGIYYQLFDSLSSRLDNFTDAFIVSNVIYSKGTGVIDEALNNYRLSKPEHNNIEVLEAYINGEETSSWKYGRYWHGYLVFLKPLFLMFNYSELRFLNVAVQIALMFGIVCLLIKRRLGRYAVPLLAAWITMCPPAVMMSLQFSQIFYITFISSAIILYFHDRFNKGKYIYVFTAIGIITSFFDMLTYPMLAFVIPVGFVFVLKAKENNSFASILRDFITLGFFWCFGYLAMWFGKWCIASVFTDIDYISQSIAQISLRTGTTVNETSNSVFAGLTNTLNVLLISPTKAVLIISTLICIAIAVSRHRLARISVTTVLPYSFMLLIPIVWIIVTCNHSVIHGWFTYRNLSASIFAALCAIIAQTEKNV